MSKLLPKWKINLLRSLRKIDEGWLEVDSYLAFLEKTPELERKIKDREDEIRDLFGISAEEFLQELSKDRPAKNFNPNNKLNKFRPKWSERQVEKLRRVRGL